MITFKIISNVLILDKIRRIHLARKQKFDGGTRNPDGLPSLWYPEACGSSPFLLTRPELLLRSTRDPFLDVCFWLHSLSVRCPETTRKWEEAAFCRWPRPSWGSSLPLRLVIVPRMYYTHGSETVGVGTSDLGKTSRELAEPSKSRTHPKQSSVSRHTHISQLTSDLRLLINNFSLFQCCWGTNPLREQVGNELHLQSLVIFKGKRNNF